ncbi:MAG: hypothetical protein EBT84_11400 [Sphingomonadaceae bacterium]|nr:hypothetical protein [Sphingomonadaceae bacterium]
MPNHRRRSAAEQNLFIAVWFTLGISGGCAFYTSCVIQSTLDTLSSSQAMALIIVDAGKNFASDDSKLGDKLNDATAALHNTCDVAYAVAVGCVIIAGALLWKMIRDRL